MKSIIQSEKRCYVTGSIYNLHEHHIFFGNPNRKRSEQYGLKVYLTAEYHNASNKGVHFNREFDLKLKELGQTAFENYHGTREEFRAIFGKSYL